MYLTTRERVARLKRRGRDSESCRKGRREREGGMGEWRESGGEREGKRKREG